MKKALVEMLLEDLDAIAADGAFVDNIVAHGVAREWAKAIRAERVQSAELIKAYQEYNAFLLKHGVGGNARSFFKEAERLTAKIELLTKGAIVSAVPQQEYTKDTIGGAPEILEWWVLDTITPKKWTRRNLNKSSILYLFSEGDITKAIAIMEPETL